MPGFQVGPQGAQCFGLQQAAFGGVAGLVKGHAAGFLRHHLFAQLPAFGGGHAALQVLELGFVSLHQHDVGGIPALQRFNPGAGAIAGAHKQDALRGVELPEVVEPGDEGGVVGPQGAQCFGLQQAAFGGVAGLVKGHAAGFLRHHLFAQLPAFGGGHAALQVLELGFVSLHQHDVGGIPALQRFNPGAGAIAGADKQDALRGVELPEVVEPGDEGGVVGHTGAQGCLRG